MTSQRNETKHRHAALTVILILTLTVTLGVACRGAEPEPTPMPQPTPTTTLLPHNRESVAELSRRLSGESNPTLILQPAAKPIASPEPEAAEDGAQSNKGLVITAIGLLLATAAAAAGVLYFKTRRRQNAERNQT